MSRLGWREYGWMVFLGITIVAIGRAASASQGSAQRSLSVAERAQIGRDAALQEPGWRASSRTRFPGDDWSQDDDFQSMERTWVNERANGMGVSPTQIFQAIDEELHAHPPAPPRKSSASPCKPRSFYD